MCAVVGWCNRQSLCMSRCFWPFWGVSLETSVGFGVAAENIFWVFPDVASNSFAKTQNVRTAINSRNVVSAKTSHKFEGLHIWGPIGNQYKHLFINSVLCRACKSSVGLGPAPPTHPPNPNPNHLLPNKLYQLDITDAINIKVLRVCGHQRYVANTSKNYHRFFSLSSH